MGMMRWMMKNAPGGPGSIAKAMGKAYRTLRREFPEDSEPQLLGRVYRSRVQAMAVWGAANRHGYSDTEAHVAVVIAECPDLHSLVFHVLRSERPELLDGPPELVMQMMDVVTEVVDDFTV